MEPFTVLTAQAAPLLRDNVDTDAIIPSREMRSVGKTGLADGLFAGWRYRAPDSREPDPAFVLNDPACAEAKILVSGANFGCGSSREHAVWALAEYGFRAVIAASFNPIFHGNCIRNGVVPVTLPVDTVARLASGLPGALTVDLEACEVRAPGGEAYGFTLAEEARRALLLGLDPIGLTLLRQDEIARFLDIDRQRRPWIYPA